MFATHVPEIGLLGEPWRSATSEETSGYAATAPTPLSTIMSTGHHRVLRITPPFLLLPVTPPRGFRISFFPQMPVEHPGVSSIGRCNSPAKHLAWFHPTERLSRAAIELPGDGVEVSGTV